MKHFAFFSCILLAAALTGCAVYPSYDDIGPYAAPAPVYVPPPTVYVRPAPYYYGGYRYHGYYGGHRHYGHWH